MAARSRLLTAALGLTLLAATPTAGLTAVQRGGDLQAALEEPSAPRVELSGEETATRVRADVARRLKVEAAAVRTIETASRTWPDAGLGCNARRGVLDPTPVPGFRVVAEANGRQFVYHTDRFGRLLRCATPAKPLDRIK
jgi:hypothetical protein